MLAKVAGPFDLIFQDGDKALYAPLLDRLVALLRPGGLLVTDNVLWDGEVVPGFVPTADAQPRRHARRSPNTTNGSTRTRSLMTAIVPLRDGVAISVKNGEARHDRRRLAAQPPSPTPSGRGLPELKPLLEGAGAGDPGAARRRLQRARECDGRRADRRPVSRRHPSPPPTSAMHVHERHMTIDEFGRQLRAAR